MERANTSPSLEGTKPTFKEKLSFFWRDFNGNVKEVDTDFTRQIQAIVDRQNGVCYAGNPLRSEERAETPAFDTQAAVVGGLVGGTYGFVIGGTCGRTLLGLDDDEEEEVEQYELRIEQA